MHRFVLTALFGLLARAAVLLRTETEAPSCPGYAASNIVQHNGHVTGADLTLAGTACNIYGSDLTDLKLLVEYQTRTSSIYYSNVEMY
jgi:alpha-glucosidase